MTAVAETMTPGAILKDRYRIVRKIGSGGMGTVYEAIQVDLGRRVALKVVRGGFEASSERIERLAREARAAAQIGHPNIVSVSDFHHTPGEPAFLVMELLAGESLAARIERKKRLSEAEVISLGVQIADGLSAAHAIGMIHRDLKPQNIFCVPISGGGHLAKILDFGIVKLAEVDVASRLTQYGTVIGTPIYMSPERLQHETTDERGDVYALGATMYEMLAGRPPYLSTSAMDVVGQVLAGPPLDIQVIQPTVSDGLARVIRSAMTRDPRHRYPTARALLEALIVLRPAGGATSDDDDLPTPDPTGDEAITVDVHTPHHLLTTLSAPTENLRAPSVRPQKPTPPPARRLPTLALGLFCAALAAVAMWFAISQTKPPPGTTPRPRAETASHPPAPATVPIAAVVAAPTPDADAGTIAITAPPIRIDADDVIAPVVEDEDPPVQDRPNRPRRPTTPPPVEEAPRPTPPAYRPDLINPFED